MTSLLLKHASVSRPSGEWNDDDYDVLAEGAVVISINDVSLRPRTTVDFVVDSLGNQPFDVVGLTAEVSTVKHPHKEDPVTAVPVPIAGAGLPGMLLIFAGGSLLGWWRRCQKTV